MVEYENLFLTKLAFGLFVKKYIIIAKNMEDADKTISNYFNDSPEVLYLLSVKKLNDLINRIQNRQDELFHLVIEIGVKKTIDNEKINEEVEFNEYEEFGLEFDELHAKYEGKQIIVLSYADIIDLITQAHEEFENEDNEVLISDFFQDILN